MPARYPMTRVVARRTLQQRRPTGRPRDIIVEVGTPARDPLGPDWYCPFRVTGLGRARVVRVLGVDQMQALILCLAKLSADLTARGPKDGLRWLGSRSLHLHVHHILRQSTADVRRRLRRRGYTFDEQGLAQPPESIRIKLSAYRRRKSN